MRNFANFAFKCLVWDFFCNKDNDMGKLIRSSNRMIAGVCGGIAENFGWSASSLRVVWILLTLVLVGSPILFYMILWFLMPGPERLSKSYEKRMMERLGRR